MKRIIVFILMVCPAIALAQNKNFTVKCRLTGAVAGLKKAYINYYNGKAYVSDSVRINGGGFVFSGLMTDDDLQRFNISLGNSLTSRKYDDDLVLFIKKGDQVEIDAPGALNKAIIKGSPQSVAYIEAEQKIAGSESADQWLNILTELARRFPDSKMPFIAFIQRFGTQNNLTQQYPDQLPQIFNLYNLFSARIKNTKQGVEYGDFLEKTSHLMAGGILPDFTSNTPEGRAVKLSDYRGKYVLVDFWASWCIPCRAEFPYLKKAYARFKSRNFEIIGFSIDEDKSLWVSALENDDVPWVNVSNLKGYKDPVAAQYNIRAVPSNFLIGPDGKVIAVNLRGEMLEPRLQQLIR